MSKPNMVKALRRIEKELKNVIGAAPHTFGPEASRRLEEKAEDQVRVAVSSISLLWDHHWGEP